MALLLNRYPLRFILRQLKRVPKIFQCDIPTEQNYAYVRKFFSEAVENKEKKAKIDFEVNILCHFSFCKGMDDFVTRFHKLWNDCFLETAFSTVKPIVGSIRLDNLHDYLVRKKPKKALLRIK